MWANCSRSKELFKMDRKPVMMNKEKTCHRARKQVK